MAIINFKKKFKKKFIIKKIKFKCVAVIKIIYKIITKNQIIFFKINFFKKYKFFHTIRSIIKKNKKKLNNTIKTKTKKKHK